MTHLPAPPPVIVLQLDNVPTPPEEWVNVTSDVPLPPPRSARCTVLPDEPTEEAAP